MAATVNGPATKADVHAVEGRLEKKIDGIDKKLDAAVERLDKKIDVSVERLAVASIKTNQRMDAMEERLVARMDSGFQRISGFIDSFLKDLKTYDRETIWLPKAVNQHSLKIEDHEKRLVRLESSPG